MAAISGTWKRTRAVQAGAMIWGTGWDPIHSVRIGTGRNSAPNPPGHLVNPILTEQYETDPAGDYGFTSEDYEMTAGFGYDTDTGTADRAPVGTPEPRANTDDFPDYRQTGERIRAEDHGAERTTETKATPKHDAAQGWLNKRHGIEEAAAPSDQSQYEMTTSMTQRHKVREGSQAQLGRASQYLQPIESRVVGQKIKTYTDDGSVRHAEMQRAGQTITIRGFWNRGAGTGPPEWVENASNSDYTNDPLQRTPPADPYQGPELGGSPIEPADEGWYY